LHRAIAQRAFHQVEILPHAASLAERPEAAKRGRTILVLSLTMADRVALDPAAAARDALPMAGASSVFSPESPPDALASQLAADIADEHREVATFAFCDSRGTVLGTRRILSSCTISVQLPLRRIVADAVLLDAVRVVMAHNHPLGEAWPSRADRDVTARLARALAAVDARLIDHVVVGRDGATWSFRAAGLL
jgi:DNA repair protein RadC